MNVISELKVCRIPLMSSKSADVISDDHQYVSCNYSAVGGTSVWSSNLERDLVSRRSSRVRIRGGGRSGGRPPNQRNPYWISGLGRGRVGSCLGRGRVEVASRSSPGRSRVCARISSMSILQCVSSGGGKQPTTLVTRRVVPQPLIHLVIS